MGVSMSKVSNPRPHAESNVDATKPDVESTKLCQEIECWENAYRERFARMVIIPSFRQNSDIDAWFMVDSLWGLVSKPVIRRLPLEDVKPSIRSRYRVQDCSPRYAGPTPEPLSAELKARTRKELVRSFDLEMEGWVRQHVRHRWLAQWNDSSGSSIPVVVSYLNQGDALPPGLMRKDFLGTDILSKVTAVYFEPGFMRCFGTHGWGEDPNDDPHPWSYYGTGCGYIAKAMVAAWREVHHCKGELANSQQYRWFANAVALEGEPSPRGALEDAVYTHKIICKELENAQNKPISSKDPYTWVEHGFEMGPIYRSLIIILDRQLAFQLGRGEDEAELCEILFDRCSVLLVCTGDEDHLNGPIDLSTLTAAGLTLPLARSDVAPIDPVGMRQVVRVRLRTAVRFVMDLERREIDASPRLTARKNVLDADTLQKAENWADNAIAHAESHGSIDCDGETWGAVRLAQAHLNGDRCGLEHESIEDSLPRVFHW